jgi:hypothetical protein
MTPANRPQGGERLVEAVAPNAGAGVSGGCR